MKKKVAAVVIILLLFIMISIFWQLNQPVGEIPALKIENDISRLITGIKLYKLDNGFYPSTEQGLSALIFCPTIGKIPSNWPKKGYMENKNLPVDPWGNEYIYRSPGEYGIFDICTYGKDGLLGGTGDNEDICTGGNAN